MERLKRKWARAVLVLIGLGVALVVLYCLLGSELFRWLFTESIYRESPTMAWVRRVLLLGGLLLMLLGIITGLWKLRCPSCKKGVAAAKWSHFDDDYCPHCGRAFPFDDAPGMEVETAEPAGRETFHLSYRQARRVWQALLTGGICMALGILLPLRTYFVEDSPLFFLKIALLFLGLGGLLAAFRLSGQYLRCPKCKKGTARPWQKLGETGYCRRCGAALVFADEPDGAFKDKKK